MQISIEEINNLPELFPIPDTHLSLPISLSSTGRVSMSCFGTLELAASCPSIFILHFLNSLLHFSPLCFYRHMIGNLY